MVELAIPFSTMYPDTPDNSQLGIVRNDIMIFNSPTTAGCILLVYFVMMFTRQDFIGRFFEESK